MKYVFLRKQFFLIFIVFLSICCFSQQSIIGKSEISTYNEALQLYNVKSFAAAKKMFVAVDKTAIINSNLKADTAYYIAMCAIKLNETDADKKVLAFVEEYPNSNKRNKIFFNTANYYFANKKAAYALKWFQKIDKDLLSVENRKEVNFKTGYGLLVTKNLKLAKDLFLPLINDAKYGNDARYYYGYIAYKLEDYSLAEATLQEIADNKSYSAEISYYLLDISFKAGNFERSIEVGKKLLETSNRKEYSEISKIIGESYFNLKNYEQAIGYLKKYKGKKGKWNNTDFYQLGYSYYEQNDFENAINYFNKIIDEKNTISQNAYNLLGECYLKVDKKTEALNAFKTASEMDFYLEIKEDAALNYAKLSYEEGNPFKNVSDVLQDYLKAYPKSNSYNEINQLLVSSFIHQQDYKGALTFLDKKKSKENIALALEVSLYRGIQLFNDKKLIEALPYFTKSKKSENINVQRKGHYWEAETTYRLENYEDALIRFVNFKNTFSTENSEFQFLDYNIGYCNFKLKNYEKASINFQDFLKKDAIETKAKDDAYIRLGDSYYATKNFDSAVKYYSIVVDEMGFGADYAQYQIGMSFGFLDKNGAKTEALKKVVNSYETSTLKDDALYQIASTYTAMKDIEKAHNAYDRLINKYPKSIFLSKSLVRQGLLYYNESENEMALEKFKKVTVLFPNSPDAIEAVKNAKNIYIDDGNLEGYIAWTNTLKFINISNSELDNTTFEIAEKQYVTSKNLEKITKSLVNYIQKFPEGIHALKANYYLAETLFNTEDFEGAIVSYQVLIAAEQNEFSEESLNKSAQIYLKKDNFNEALPLLERLEQEAYATENLLFAQSNLMQGYFETESYDLAIEYATKILQKDKLENSLEYDAKTIIARASFKTDDLLTAEEYYTEIERNAIGELKAEALYYSAYFKNLEKEYTASNKIIQNLIANYATYKYWAVNSYVIMGKNYYGLNDVYQATFVLENVIKNFTQFEDIVQTAQSELNSIKEKESKINNSVISKKLEMVGKERKN